MKSQAAMLVNKNNIVRSSTVLACINSLNKLGESNHVIITWTLGYIGIYGNETADISAKSGSALKYLGPESFIPIPYAKCLRSSKWLEY